MPDTHLGYFKLKGELTDGHQQTPYSFKIEVFNEAPYFVDILVDQYIYVGGDYTYQLPSAEDAEFLPIKYSASLMKEGKPGPLP